MISKPCSFKDCTRPFLARGYCQGHYRQMYRGTKLSELKNRPIGSPALRDTEGRKKCSRCSEWTSIENYHNQKSTEDGLASTCKRCVRDGHLIIKYGIGIDKYNEMLTNQGGKCTICQKTPETSLRNFSVDHDHACCPGKKSCGKCIRSIICGNCNTMIGMANDNSDILVSGAMYIMSFKNVIMENS